MLTRMRIWLPDAPGVLGAVAAEIGAVQGNVIGLEVLEREAGVAIDELVVELPDEPGAVDAVCRGVRNVPGAGVEEVTRAADGGARTGRTPSSPPPPAILQAATPTAAMNALDRPAHGAVRPDLAGRWPMTSCRLHRGARRRARQCSGWPRSPRARSSGADPANDTTGSGVFVEADPRDRAHRLRRATRADPAPGAARDRHAGHGGGSLHRRARLARPGALKRRSVQSLVPASAADAGVFERLRLLDLATLALATLTLRSRILSRRLLGVDVLAAA